MTKRYRSPGNYSPPAPTLTRRSRTFYTQAIPSVVHQHLEEAGQGEDGSSLEIYWEQLEASSQAASDQVETVARSLRELLSLLEVEGVKMCGTNWD